MMLKLAITGAFAVIASVAHAQPLDSTLPREPSATKTDTTRPFLFDAVLPGDPVNRKPQADASHRHGGAVVVPPKSSRPEQRP